MPTAPSISLQLVPAERFFTRTIALDSEADATAQVELALEGFSPFPLAQLYYGYLPSADKKQAFVFAAYRRQFSHEETAAWAEAAVVVPGFVAYLTPPAKAPALCAHAESTRTSALAWRAEASLPVLLLTRAHAAEATAVDRALLADLENRTGLTQAPHRSFTQTPIATWDDKTSGLRFAATDGPALATFTAAQLATMDVRDKEQLADLRKNARQASVYWRCLLGCAAALVLATLLELVTWGGGFSVAQLKARVDAQAPHVAAIENAQALATRIDDLSGKRLRPLEMIAALNQQRPDGVTFLRSATNGLYTMEVEAQTRNSDEAASYESALRASGLYEKIEVRDLRSRDGLTSFIIVAKFRPEALQGGGST